MQYILTEQEFNELKDAARKYMENKDLINSKDLVIDIIMEEARGEICIHKPNSNLGYCDDCIFALTSNDAGFMFYCGRPKDFSQ